MLPALRFLTLMTFAFASLVSITSAEPSNAEFTNTVVLTDDQGEYPLGRHLMILEDRGSSYTLDEVIETTDGFSPATSSVPNFGVSKSTFWSIVQIENRSNEKSLWYLEFNEPMAQYVDVWILKDDSEIIHMAAGSMRPRSNDTLGDRTHVFKVNVERERSAKILLRLRTDYVSFWPVTLWSTEHYSTHKQRESILHGLYYGVMFAMLFYNFFMWINVREVSYLLYVGYVASIVVVQACLNGTMGGLLLSDNPRISNILFICCYMAAAVFTFLFSKAFLPNDKIIKIISNLGVVSTSILFATWLFTNDRIWSHGLQMLVAMGFSMLLISGARIAVRRDISAIFFTLGFGWFLGGSIAFLMVTRGLLPLNSFTFYSVEIGGAFEAIFLSLGLAQRMREVKQQNELSQKDLLESKVEILRIVSEYNAKLESDVKARTTELIATQQKLVASEKMAALGVFTAGMAHEINNPANFVAAGAQNAEYAVQKLQMFVDELLDDDADPDIKDEFNDHFGKITGAHEVIKTGIKRIEHVVKQLRSDHPEGDVGMQRADAVDSLESAWRVLSPTVRTPIVLSTQFSARPQIACMIAEISQVFLALLSNAAHAIEDAVAMNGADYRGEIKLASHEADGKLVITVSDNGIGIPADKIDKVFDPFFTTKTVGRGAGLGLSMARDVVTKHGGTLDVESMEGRGALFTLILPSGESTG